MIHIDCDTDCMVLTTPQTGEATHIHIDCCMALTIPQTGETTLSHILYGT